MIKLLRTGVHAPYIYLSIKLRRRSFQNEYILTYRKLIFSDAYPSIRDYKAFHIQRCERFHSIFLVYILNTNA